MGQHGAEGAVVGQDVDQRLDTGRCSPCLVVGECSSHDRDERVVAALGGGAGERVAVGAVAVFGATGGDVGVVLELAGVLEDRFELDIDEWVASAAIETQRSVEVDDAGAPVGDRLVEVAVGAVEVGEHHEPLHTGAELAEAESLGQLDQHRGEFGEPVADPPVGVGHGEFVGLCGADVAVVEGFGDAGEPRSDGGESTDSRSFGIGVVAGGLQVGLQRAVPVVEV